MTDTYETRRAAQVAETTFQLVGILNTFWETDHRSQTYRLDAQRWDAPTDLSTTGQVSQPLDPGTYGFGIIYAETNPQVDGSVILVSYGEHSPEYIKVAAYQPHDYDADRSYKDKGWGVMPRDFYSTDIHIPREVWGKTGLQPSEVSMTGGGVRDAARVSSAARCLSIASFIATMLDAKAGLR